MNSKYLILVFLVFLGGLSRFNAQTIELNLQKYWKFRTDFVEKYVKIGSKQGESLPAGLRSPGICIDNLSEWHNNEYGTMHWGDGVIRHGHYLGLLATEYALFKSEGLDTKGVLNELYYAIEAINRLDRTAEVELDDVYGLYKYYDTTLNGFYLREDIGEDFCLNWENEPMNFRCTNSSFYHNNNVAKLHDPEKGYIHKEKTSYQNVPSLDQMTSILVGLSVVHKLVDNIFVKPTDQDHGFKIRDEIAAITDRMVGYAAQRNWMLVDVNGWPVGNGGGDLVLSAAPILAAAERITGKKNYKRIATRRLQRAANVQYCLTGYGLSSVYRDEACDQIHTFDLFEHKAWNGLQDGIPIGDRNNQNESVYQEWLQHGALKIPVRRLKWLWKSTMGNFFPKVFNDLHADGNLDMLIWPLNKIDLGKDAITHFNNTIFFNLGVSSGWWDSEKANTWGDATENRQLELINAILTDANPTENMEFYQRYLDSFDPSGAYRLKGLHYGEEVYDTIIFQSNGWGSEYRWTHPYASYGVGGEEGIFSGLDYMYFHNLFYLIYKDQLPQYDVNYNCFCDLVPETQINKDDKEEVRSALLDLNRKLSYLPYCVPSVSDDSNVLYRDLLLEPHFKDYNELGIRTVRYLTGNLKIEANNTLDVHTDLVVGAGVTLEIKGELNLSKGKVLHLSTGTKVKVMDGAKLIVDDGGDIRIGENVNFEISDNSVIMCTNKELENRIRSVVD